MNQVVSDRIEFVSEPGGRLDSESPRDSIAASKDLVPRSIRFESCSDCYDLPENVIFCGLADSTGLSRKQQSDRHFGSEKFVTRIKRQLFHQIYSAERTS